MGDRLPLAIARLSKKVAKLETPPWTATNLASYHQIILLDRGTIKNQHHLMLKLLLRISRKVSILCWRKGPCIGNMSSLLQISQSAPQK